MVELVVTEPFGAWFDALGAKDQQAVVRYMGLLRDGGYALGFPYSSAIRGSQLLRELRVQSRGRPIRVFYAFDPERNAVLLLGGHKTNERRFYRDMIPKAERIYHDYLETRED